MTIGLALAVRNARMEAVKAAIDAGATPGVIEYYTATRPATGAAITTQTLIASATCSDPCGTVSAGNLDLAAIADGVAVAVGQIAWARVRDGDGTFVMDLGVGLVGSGAEIEIDDPDVTEVDSLVTVVGTPRLYGGNAS